MRQTHQIDIEGLDRVLERLGYDSDVKRTPRVPRAVPFHRGELRQFLSRQTRERDPRTSRRMAEAFVRAESKDARDRWVMDRAVA